MTLVLITFLAVLLYGMHENKIYLCYFYELCADFEGVSFTKVDGNEVLSALVKLVLICSRFSDHPT